MDWQAFLDTLKDVQAENQDTPLAMQAIEDKGDGVFVAKVHIPPDADKEKIHGEITATYEQKLQLQATQYEAQLAAKDGQLADYKEHLQHTRE